MKTPLIALVQAVAAGFAAAAIPLTGDGKRSPFRINRDVRFSHDKSPYKTHAACVWTRPGGSKTGSGVLYFHLANEGCFMGAAFYRPAPDVLDSLREGIRIRPDSFTTMLTALASTNLTLDMDDSLTRMPRGFEDFAGTDLAPYLRLRSFLLRRPLTLDQVASPTLIPALTHFASAALPLLQFGWRAVDEVAQAA